jgi:hypothetical protein
MNESLEDRITIDPEMCNGKPLCPGTLRPRSAVLGLIQPRQGRQDKARGRSAAETPGKRIPEIFLAPAGATGEPGA